MSRYRGAAALIAVALSIGLAASVGAQMVLDGAPEAGDQGLRVVQAKPGGPMKLELLSTVPLKGLVGIEVELRFDPKAVKFAGFMPDGAMKGAVAMPPTQKPDGVTVAAALMGKQANAEKPGTLGIFQFELSPQFGPETFIKLVGGSYGTAEGTKKFELQEGVKLVVEGAAKPGEQMQPPGQQRQPPGQQMQPPGQQKQPPGQQMQPPGQQPAGKPGMPPGPPSSEDMNKMYEMWKQGPMAKDLNGDGKVDEGDFKKFLGEQKPPMGPPGQPPMGPPGQPPMGPPMQPSQEHMQKMYEMWKQGPMAKDLNGDGKVDEEDFKKFVGEQKPPMGPPGQQPPGGRPGEPMGPVGPPPSPEEAIKTLPQPLQSSYTKALEQLKASGRAHMEAELKMLNVALQTLKETEAYLPKASDAEKQAIANALFAFDQMGPKEPGPQMGHGGPPMGPPGGPGGPMGPMPPKQMGPGPMGPQGPGGPPVGMKIEEEVRKMIQETQMKIERIQQEMKMMGN